MAYKTVSVAGGRKKKVRVHKKIHFYRTKTLQLQRNPRYEKKAVNQLKQEARAPKVRPCVPTSNVCSKLESHIL